MITICGKKYHKDIEELDISNKGLTELPKEIQYLTKLKKLNFSHNKIISLDYLPYNLKKLNCSFNQITILDNLPPNLQTLDCSNNPLIYTFKPTIENIREYHKQ